MKIFNFDWLPQYLQAGKFYERADYFWYSKSKKKADIKPLS
jgi:hypothetical protein